MNSEAIFKIEKPDNIKAERSWDFVNKILKHGGYKVDLRKASKTNTPLAISCNCCNTTLNIKRKKDFPLKDKWCKCGKTKMIEWKFN